METVSRNHKRRGFMIKSKLAASLSWAAKSKPFSEVQYASKVKPESYSGNRLPKHDCLNHSSFTPANRGPSTGAWAEPVGQGQRGSYYYYGFGVGNGDENVDAKAASYITIVRERFETRRFDMDEPNNKCQDVR
ncbi:hypothetical protein CDL15_Pgr024527 [Punica granatum]|uniref:Uncharacterized protein n=1 Tax=Punica granatum TaxID=22663 RepID=A0A218XYV0_PUNGR|nr:hypothetical protein CDL15_Pgr024527 [Punica granatum]PKI41903.1 hypothetical protein CRG98_037705 [Punica granatum]